MTDTNKKALDLLKKSRNTKLTDEEKRFCIENGVLSVHEPVSHNELISQIKLTASHISLKSAARGFLYSVSTGDHRYRTALSSFLWAKALPEHECVPSKVYRNQYHCEICGGDFSEDTKLSEPDMTEHCRNRLFPSKDFSDTACAGYVLNDLTEFAKLPQVSFCDEDIRIINRITGLAGELASANKINALLKNIAAEKSLSLTAADAYSVLGVLGSIGMFDTPEHKGVIGGFTPCGERGFVYEIDIYYPLNHWRAKHGLCYDRIAEVFGKDIAEKISPETAIKGKAERKASDKGTSVSKAEQYFTEGIHLVEPDDRHRYYYGLEPINPKWDKVTKFSVTHSLRKRSEIYFEGNTVKKLIYEEQSGDDGYRSYTESDMNVPTVNRELILPKTSRGREQPLTPSLLQTPAYMQGTLYVTLNSTNGCGAFVFNPSNDQELPLPQTPSFNNAEEFIKYTEDYIASCPADYYKQLDNFKNKKRVTVKFTAGDIFRVQLTPTLYTYCLILGKTRQIEKWHELPDSHPFRGMMSQPIAFRQYGIVTENPNMTPEELEKIPLSDVNFAQDNEILWETYPIVCSKKLIPSDIDLGFGINKAHKTIVWGLAVHTEASDSADFFNIDKKDNISLSHNAKTNETYMVYGVALGINIDPNGYKQGLIPLSETKTHKLKKAVAEHYGFNYDTAFDEFAEKFGGITRSRYIELAEKRFKK